jgi:hypothetical protein
MSTSIVKRVLPREGGHRLLHRSRPAHLRSDGTDPVVGAAGGRRRGDRRAHRLDGLPHPRRPGPQRPWRGYELPSRRAGPSPMLSRPRATPSLDAAARGGSETAERCLSFLCRGAEALTRRDWPQTNESATALGVAAAEAAAGPRPSLVARWRYRQIVTRPVSDTTPSCALILALCGLAKSDRPLCGSSAG